MARNNDGRNIPCEGLLTMDANVIRNIREVAQTLMQQIKDLGLEHQLVDLAFAKMETSVIALVRLQQEIELSNLPNDSSL